MEKPTKINSIDEVKVIKYLKTPKTSKEVQRKFTYMTEEVASDMLFDLYKRGFLNIEKSIYSLKDHTLFLAKRYKATDNEKNWFSKKPLGWSGLFVVIISSIVIPIYLKECPKENIKLNTIDKTHSILPIDSLKPLTLFKPK